MAEPTPEKRNAFLWMQGRMVELLLRHDAQRFTATFDTRTGDEEQHDDPRLRRYRVLAVLFYLRDDLFDGIIPRIKRRLSFVAPREVEIGALPPRGRIDWNRTLTASWRERPGELPLEVHTRQCRRHFATPENLLTVATLLEYRSLAQTLLDAESARVSAQAIRHPLHEIVDGCTRELVFPQFAGLVAQVARIVSGVAGQTVADLERYGALLFAFHGGQLDAFTTDEASDPSTAPAHLVAPGSVMAQYAQPDIRIHSWRATPQIASDLGDLENTLRTMVCRSTICCSVPNPMLRPGTSISSVFRRTVARTPPCVISKDSPMVVHAPALAC